MTPLQALEKKYQVRLNVFPGTDSTVTEEQVAAEVEKSIIAILNGDAE